MAIRIPPGAARAGGVAADPRAAPTGARASGPPSQASVRARVTASPTREAARLAIKRAQAREVETQLRERVLDRVDRLVRGMEALAERISSGQVSTSQKSVLLSRFNDLERQVNRLDGIVGSEGREVEGREALRPAAANTRPGRAENRESDLAQVRDMRRQVRLAMAEAADQRRHTRQVVEEHLAQLPAPQRVEVERAAAAADRDIRGQGGDAAVTAMSGQVLDTLA